ncbi:MAG TPA: hypothetical protein VFN50_03945 [Acidimicrobiales bacterium]|nr:hypothetical protein [Acidimicrobiales bacterium]
MSDEQEEQEEEEEEEEGVARGTGGRGAAEGVRRGEPGCSAVA